MVVVKGLDKKSTSKLMGHFYCKNKIKKNGGSSELMSHLTYELVQEH